MSRLSPRLLRRRHEGGCHGGRAGRRAGGRAGGRGLRSAPTLRGVGVRTATVKISVLPPLSCPLRARQTFLTSYPPKFRRDEAPISRWRRKTTADGSDNGGDGDGHARQLAARRRERDAPTARRVTAGRTGVASPLPPTSLSNSHGRAGGRMVHGRCVAAPCVPAERTRCWPCPPCLGRDCATGVLSVGSGGEFVLPWRDRPPSGVAGAFKKPRPGVCVRGAAGTIKGLGGRFWLRRRRWRLTARRQRMRSLLPPPPPPMVGSTCPLGAARAAVDAAPPRRRAWSGTRRGRRGR